MRRGAFTAVFLAVAMGASGAQFDVGSGASLDLGTGSLDLGCADLTVGGTLSAGTAGFSQARDVTIDPTGLVNGNSATLEVAGDWDNAGSFNAGTSTVEFVDGCALASAVITGDTTFASLDMTTTTGKLYSFTAGSTQTVTQAISLAGASGNLLTLRSTVDCVKAFIDNQGSHFGEFVDVDCIGVTTNLIFLGPNSVIGQNSQGMGFLFLVVVPALGALGLTLLMLSLLWSGRRALATRRGSLAAR